MGNPSEANSFKRSRNIPFPLLSDTGQGVYKTYGLTHINPAAELRAGSMQALFSETVHGNFAGIPVGDVTQLGGTFLVDKQGITRYAHRDRSTNGYPAMRDLLTIVKQAQTV